MKVLLLAFSVQKNIFPLGLASLKAYAQKHHPDTNIQIKEFSFGQRYNYQTNRNLELQALSYIKIQKPDLIAFSCYIWSGELIRDFARAIKTLLPNTKILLGGVEVGQATLYRHVDYFIQGEGEIAFNELLTHLQKKMPIEQVHNLLYWKDNQIQQNKKIQITDLDTLPFSYTLTDFGYNHDVIRLETARGCLYSCNFCHYAKPTLRHHSLQYLKKNITYLFNNYNFKYLTILDANFNTNFQRMSDILDIIEQNIQSTNKRITLHIELRPELTTIQVVSRLKQFPANISTELGLQSADPLVLKAANRPTNLEKVKKALNLLSQAYIPYKVDLMYGLPRDTFFKFLSSASFILNNALSQHKLIAHHFMPLNNTSFQDILRFSPNHSSMVIKTDTQDILDFHQTKLFLDELNEELRILQKFN